MMHSGRNYSEDTLVEQPTIELFEALGWDTYHGLHEFDSGPSPLGRETRAEVVLTQRLRPALERLNPDLPPAALDVAIETLTRDRGAMSLARANAEVYAMLRDGVRVTFTDPETGEQRVETAQVVNWDDPGANDYLLVSQFWVTGEFYTRRADLVGFVNGLPLVFLELKASHRQLKDAFDHNLTDYKDTIPHLFWYNAFILLSNGSATKMGSITALWGHFFEWKKIADEEEPGVVSLETAVRGTCRPDRLLDLVENFCVFREDKGGLIKLVAMNHQYLGVNNAIRALHDIESRQGRLGVFWHTQGSGKSLSMLFFSRKVLRKVAGAWTFVVVTDRQDLDDQIYKTFARCGAVTEKDAQATSSAHLRRLLGEDHRYVFTLIHKFRTEPGTRHPVLSTRSDIIVMTDEAHRSQYDTLALNMRTALPNASFIAFTGTPLIVGEEKTRQVFGDYVSIYDFGESMADGATVPLYYENRIPELQLTNESLNEDMERLLEEAELDEAQESRLEREFSRQYHLITREERLETVAGDIVEHFLGRGFQGKAMVVCIDKATAVRMYDKVRAHWQKKLEWLRAAIVSARPVARPEVEEQIRYMEGTDMAVVISQGQNEIQEMRAKGLDILPHRRRMNEEDLDEKFKDPDDPFRIVFVCAMWMTGFDVPSCSTIYLDKPMRNHTLMQTIARANRVFPEKVNGLIVDYVGVFRNLQRALAIYGAGGGEEIGESTSVSPVQDKEALVQALRSALEAAEAFCAAQKIDLAAIPQAEGFERIRLMDDAVDLLVVRDERKLRYLSLADDVNRLFKAILPDSAAEELAPRCVLLRVLSDKVRSLEEPADISRVMGDVEELLDESVAAQAYVIREPSSEYRSSRWVDLSQIDFEALRKRFETQHKHTEAQKLRGMLNAKLQRMVRLNRTRLDFLQRFRQMIDEYNAGSANIDEFFHRLIEFTKELSEEEQRAASENLSEEHLAVLDLLTRPEIELTSQERRQVKQAAEELLETLKREKLVLDWRKRQQARAQVRVTIESILDRDLPPVYSEELFRQKCDAVYQHVFECYAGAGRSIYAGLG